MSKRCMIAALAMSALVAGGCGASEESTPASNADGAAAKSAQDLTIGVSNLGFGFPFPAAISQGMKEEAASLGVEIVELDAKGDANKQANDVQDLIAQKPDGVIINPVDGGVAIGMVKQLKAADIPVAAVNSQVGDPKKVAATYVHPDLVAWIGQDEVEAGAVAGEMAARALPSGGKIAVVEGAAGFSAVKLRLDGFKKGLGDAVDSFEIVASQPGDWVQDKSEAACQNMLASHPEIELIYAEADDMAVGCQKALDAKGSKAKVIGIGGSKLAVQDITSGKLYGTVCYKPIETGKIALRTLVNHLTGEQPKQAEFVPLPAPATTKDTAGDCPGEW
ncbi:MAG TPA: sugar ABC transporter substrate-binding protein [Solirubrobacteraceae bacterium]|nr:sugar ABC transporter substrate-binding protein [Solirubrobacteraceae bacterium]